MTTPTISTLLLAIKTMNAADLVTLIHAAQSELQKQYEDMKTAAIHWTPPSSDCVRRWFYKGTFYFRDAEDNVWHVDTCTGRLGDWKGRYLPAEDTIDTGADEP